MTDTITPASLRAHAGHFASKWPLVCEALNDEAARLEAESARDEEAERWAKVYYDGPAVQKAATCKWEFLPAPSRQLIIAGFRAVLDQLAADGRLLPEGGIQCPSCNEMVGRKNMARHRNRLHPEEMARQDLSAKGLS